MGAAGETERNYAGAPGAFFFFVRVQTRQKVRIETRHFASRFTFFWVPTETVVSVLFMFDYRPK